MRTRVVAWLVDGSLYCPEHCIPTEEEQDTGYASPIFAGNEGWKDHCCDTCSAIAAETGEQLQTLGEANGFEPPFVNN